MHFGREIPKKKVSNGLGIRKALWTRKPKEKEVPKWLGKYGSALWTRKSISRLDILLGKKTPKWDIVKKL